MRVRPRSIGSRKDGDVPYGLHDYRATLFAFDVRKRQIVSRRRELGLGDHCWNAPWLGPDDRIWGLTRECVFAAGRDLNDVEVVTRYRSLASGGYSCFGVARSEDGSVYFPNGTHLMRLREDRPL